jgi:tripartite-type tricarboxylate transporter receptor subunit TctC
MKHSWLILLPALGLATLDARAQTWPTKPLKAIVPVAAGSLVDIVPRIVFEQLSMQLGQSIIVENRPGAGATIGTSLVAKADPDGYTILVNSSAHAIAPSLYANLSYDPALDFAAAAPLGITPFVLVVPPARGFKTVRDFVAAANAKPGASNFSSLGGACSVQGWSRGDDRGDRGTDRFLPRGDRGCSAAHSRRQALCACGEQRQALRRAT